MTEAFYREMEKWQGRGKYVVMTTQIAKEGSHMTIYEVGKRVKRDFNLIESYDMSFEATITKLMWISGLGVKNYEELRELFYTQINHDILFTKRIESE
jgi:L-asparaginase